MEVGIGDDGTTRHFVERDVLGRQARRRGNGHAVGQALGIEVAPGQGLHAAQRAAHDSGKALDAQRVGQACLAVHPVLRR